jgi:hypothetical protein
LRPKKPLCISRAVFLSKVLCIPQTTSAGAAVVLKAGPASDPEMDGLAATGLKLSAGASTAVLLTAGPASSSGRGAMVTGATSPAVARSRAVLVRGWVVTISMVVASLVAGESGKGIG